MSFRGARGDEESVVFFDFCEREIPRFARNDNQEHFFSKLLKTRGYSISNKCRRRCCRSSEARNLDRKSTRLNSSHGYISYAVFCLKKKNPPLVHDIRCSDTQLCT